MVSTLALLIAPLVVDEDPLVWISVGWFAAAAAAAAAVTCLNTICGNFNDCPFEVENVTSFCSCELVVVDADDVLAPSCPSGVAAVATFNTILWADTGLVLKVLEVVVVVDCWLLPPLFVPSPWFIMSSQSSCFQQKKQNPIFFRFMKLAGGQNESTRNSSPFSPLSGCDERDLSRNVASKQNNRFFWFAQISHHKWCGIWCVGGGEQC